MPEALKRVAVLLSGGGRTLQNLLDLSAAGELGIELVLVGSSSSKAYGLTRAREAGIPTQVFRRSRAAGDAAYADTIFTACREAGAELVCLAGFLKLLSPIPGDFQGRVLNVHPSLIPSFCGRGFYGERVHAAVLRQGAKLSGCTVHLVDDAYDRGPILIQRAVPVLEEDDTSSLAARVFAEECLAYPAAIRLLLEDRVRVEEGRARILPPR